MSELLNPEVFLYVARNMRSGLYLVDTNRKVVFWNSGAERITGYLQQEMLGRCCMDNLLVHCDKDGLLLCGNGCPVAEAMRDGKIVEAGMLVHHKSGHSIPVLACAIPVRNAAGEVIGAAECFDRHVLPPSEAQAHDGAFVPLNEHTALPESGFSYAYLQSKLRNFSSESRAFTVVRLELAEIDKLRESLGAEAALAILRPLAETLKASMRNADYLGMWGELGFLLIIGTGWETSPEITGRRFKNLSQTASANWWGDRLVPITVVKATTAQVGDTVESLLERLETLPSV